LKRLGVRTVIALLVPEADVALKILALNTEKAHNLREKSLETIRMARALARTSNQPERDFAFEFEQPAFLTLGVCYEERPRLSGGAYQPILRRVDEFLSEPIARAVKERERRAKKILKLDDAVSAAVEKLKARGLTSPYLKAFVVAR
jgi:ParB family chromosome partitioning protein